MNEVGSSINGINIINILVILCVSEGSFESLQGKFFAPLKMTCNKFSFYAITTKS